MCIRDRNIGIKESFSEDFLQKLSVEQLSILHCVWSVSYTHLDVYKRQRLYNTGQVCCASKRFLIHNSRKQEFIDRMKAKIATLKVGNPAEMDTDIGCLVNEPAAIRVEEQVNQTIEQGATLVIGGKRNGALYEPTILDNVTKDMDVAKDMEIFGPVISISGFDDIQEAIEIANQSSYGLCGCVITRDYSRGIKIANQLECGGAVVNGASFYLSLIHIYFQIENQE